ncbi:MAG: VOC family protein [Salinivirgaceae bacterium]
MYIEHIGIWTSDLKQLKAYYEVFFGGIANALYENRVKQFRSYFISFESGTRLELMTKTDMDGELNLQNQRDKIGISHLAFGVDSIEAVIEKADQLRKAGFAILDGPRITGDGYFEFVTLDPDGNRIEVSSHATHSDT